MKTHFLGVLGLCVALACVPAGHSVAQVNPFDKRARIHLADKDRVLMRETRDEVLAANAEDAVRRWSNPESGNSGITTLTRSFSRQGLRCREVRYDLAVNGQNRRFVVPYCLAEDGIWKIAF